MFIKIKDIRNYHYEFKHIDDIFAYMKLMDKVI